MEVIGCGKGHFYNPNEYSSCPQCAKENGGAMPGFSDVLGATEPVDFMGFAGGVQDIGATEPVCFDPNSDILQTTDFKDPAGGVQGYGPTVPVAPVISGNGGNKVPFLPVVGWLVCVDGPAKGRDYRIHSHYNYIGRAQHMDICISGDDCISAEKAAILAYDDQEKFFSFGPGMGHNVVRVNGKMLMNAVVLNAYDELTIGNSKLLFVPLCGERFDWNDR